jgi:hypothetical protein
VFAAWIVSGKATRTPDGPSEVPTWMVAVIHTWEVLGFLAFLAMAYFFVVRPWRREGRLTLDGMFVVAFLATYWQDPLFNWAQPWATYNTHTSIQLGSWGSNIPGWLSPNGNLLAEPLSISAPMYVWAMFGGVVVLNVAMRKAKERWPQLGRAGLVGFCFLCILVIDLIAEPLMIRLGLYAYPGAIPGWTVNQGKYYQFPIYQVVLTAGLFTAWASIRYFRNDKGQTMAERGIERVRGGPRAHTGLRLLALIGVCNAVFAVVYIVPSQFFALHAGAWPKDIVDRSYLTDGLCGPGTTYACPGSDVPIPRPRSAHLGPDGNLVPSPR